MAGDVAETFAEQVERRHEALKGQACPARAASAAETTPPVGQAAAWLEDVTPRHPKSAHEVAWQLARLCGEDSTVTMPQRSLAQAVAVRDRAGRNRAYTETGVKCLTRSGWLRWRSNGRGRHASTTYELLPGPLSEPSAQ